MGQMNRTWRERVAELVIGALVGIVGTLLALSLGQITFDRKLHSGNVLQAFATLAAAAVVSTYLQRQSTSARKEKDILFRCIDLQIDGLVELQERVHVGVLIEINAALKKVSSMQRTVGELLENFPGAASQHRGCDEILQQLRQLTTNTELKDSLGHPSATVSNDRIRFSDARMLDIEAKIHFFRKRLLNSELLLNRH